MNAESARLLEQLKDPNKAKRTSAAEALREFEHIDCQCIEPLIEASQDVDSEVRLSAVTTLVSVWRTLNGPAGDYWTEEGELDRFFVLVNHSLKRSLQDQDKYVRVMAAEGLRELYCSDQEVFDVFKSAARDEDESLRNRAAIAFWMGASDTRAPLWQVRTGAGIAVIVDLLADASERVRKHALSAISSVGLTDKLTASGLSEVLLKLLRDPDQDVRFTAACALASSTDGSEAALPILIESLSDNDRLKRKAAAFALRTMGTDAAPAIPALIAALKDDEAKVRARSAEALGQFGAAAGDLAVYALLGAELEAERNNDCETSLATKRALAAIGKHEVDAAQRRAAARKARDFFPLLGFKPEEIPFWILMLWDPDANQRARAVNALGHLGAVEAIPELRRLLSDDDEDVRRRVDDVLKRFGNDGSYDN